MSGSGEAVCEGWLRKSPPEKKLRRYAWKRRWFMLRSGRLTGDPDVLQYYKHSEARKPIRTINLSLCEQVDAGLSFTKKELESSFVFDLRTSERTWYLVADSEDDMNRWVAAICLLCGFSPTEDVHTDGLPVSAPPVHGHAPVSVVTGSVPATERQPGLSGGSAEEEYLLLSHCHSSLPPSSSSPDPKRVTTAPPSSNAWTASWSTAMTTGHPGQSDLELESDSDATSDLRWWDGRWPGSHPSPHPRKHSLHHCLQPAAIPLSSLGYLVPRPVHTRLPYPPLSSSSSSSSSSTSSTVEPLSKASPQSPISASTLTPPPRPPKPKAEGSVLDRLTATLPRCTADGGVTGEGERVREGSGQARSGMYRRNTVATLESTETGMEFYTVPRSARSERASMFEFSESFNSYFLNKGMVPLSGLCSEDDNMDENYVPMSAATTEPPIPAHSSPTRPPAPPPSSVSDPQPRHHEPSYVSMTPLTPCLTPRPPAPSNLSHVPATLGRLVPPPAHLGFRAPAKSTDAARPPPVHRNLKPQCRVEVSDSQPAPLERNEPNQRVRVKPVPLDLRPQQEWEEVPPPIRSPVTRTFTRLPSSSASILPCSARSSSPSSDSEDADESIIAMTTSGLSFDRGRPFLRLMVHRASDGGASSPLLWRSARDRTVEYLDLDLHTWRETPTGQTAGVAEECDGGREGQERARVDYVVVDPERTRALRNTREAWHDGRTSSDKDK